MPEIPPIGHGSIGPINRVTEGGGRVTATQTVEPAVSAGDRVELSPHARLLDRIRQLPEVRHDLIDRIKGEIETGTYDTTDKLDAALDELIVDLHH